MSNINMPQKIEKKAAAFIAKSPKVEAGETGKSVVNMRMDNDLLARIDQAAKRMGISRSAWLHVAANRMIDGA